MTTQQFQSVKAAAIKQQPLRKEITLSEFNVLSPTQISIGGTAVSITPHAFHRLLGRLRIPTAFAKRFSQGFGDDGLRQLVHMIQTQKFSKNDQTITLIVDPIRQEITDILPAGYASISNESFFELSERYINQYNLHIVDASSTGSDSAINLVQDSTAFSVPGLADEVFQTGVTFRNTPTRGVQVSPFLNRLVCSNGITSTQFAETFSLHTLSDSNISEFNDHMLRMAGTGFVPAGLVDTISRARGVDASLAELNKATSGILSVCPDLDLDWIQRYVPLNRANSAWKQAGADPSGFTQAQLKNAKSGMSVWDLVNGITNFASNDTRHTGRDSARMDLMVAAGNLLTKRAYDTEGLLRVDPFANRELLTQREAEFVRGDRRNPA